MAFKQKDVTNASITLLRDPSARQPQLGWDHALGGIWSLSPPGALGEAGRQKPGLLVSRCPDATGGNALLPRQPSLSVCSPPGSFLGFSSLHLPSSDRPDLPIQCSAQGGLPINLLPYKCSEKGIGQQVTFGAHSRCTLNLSTPNGKCRVSPPGLNSMAVSIVIISIKDILTVPYLCS